MREIFRGKRVDIGEYEKPFDNEWVEGDGIHYPKSYNYIGTCWIDIMGNKSNNWVQVIPETVGRYSQLPDRNGTKIFEGDIVQYKTIENFVCQSVVKYGRYEQDGSSGEYAKRNCIGFFVEVKKITCPDWCDNEPERFPEYLVQQNLLEVSEKCEVIGNIHDNPLKP